MKTSSEVALVPSLLSTPAVILGLNHSPRELTECHPFGIFRSFFKLSYFIPRLSFFLRTKEQWASCGKLYTVGKIAGTQHGARKIGAARSTLIVKVRTISYNGRTLNTKKTISAHAPCDLDAFVEKSGDLNIARFRQTLTCR